MLRRSARRNFVEIVTPAVKDGRLQCLVPGCRRTVAKGRLDPAHTEWICGDHWRLVPSRLKRLRTRARRRRSAEVESMVWHQIRKAVVDEVLMGLGI